MQPSAFKDQIVAPGDRVLDLPEAGVLRIGSGLYDDGRSLIAYRTGLLHQDSGDGSKLWIESDHRKYLPRAGDSVLGIVRSKGAEYYEVDIGAPFLALLPVLAFEGVTRRNRPILKEGDLVYCRVETANRDIQPTVVCTDASGRASGFGLLTGGMLVHCFNSTCRSLLAQPMPEYLAKLGGSLRFEIAVGLNGRVWVNAGDMHGVIVVSKALRACDGKTNAEKAKIVDEVLKDVR